MVETVQMQLTAHELALVRLIQEQIRVVNFN